ncbi:hypothetical protein G4X40_10890 [Rhodococcus sp. D2-41]|uniref:Uncharacterized protein n=1 Tax=Speluncibacter jeojiensis TaxID=2710754 RepID=A0A9X4M7T1_9ACTN|nr:hypothetical protein [Rhodococcus sp. D2-41]MDG3010654.1 hypothetical protein [Rhodococcus sp. D2-41]MDG3016833.1 hypothetical protein [Corynebacteriales bacterium D3-21]
MNAVADAMGLAGRGLDAARGGPAVAASVIAGVCGAPTALLLRARQIAALLDRLGGALDDLSELVGTTRRITAQLDVLSETALNLGDCAGEISRDAVAIVDALDHVERLAAFVDRIPGGRRRAVQHQIASRQPSAGAIRIAASGTRR